MSSRCDLACWEFPLATANPVNIYNLKLPSQPSSHAAGGQLPWIAAGSEPSLFQIVSTATASHLVTIRTQLVMGDFALLVDLDDLRDAEEEERCAMRDKVLRCFESSLSWGSFEQTCFWQLACSEFQVKGHWAAEHILTPLLPKLNPSDHGEAMNGVLSAGCVVPPTPGLLLAAASLRFPGEGTNRYGEVLLRQWAQMQPTLWLQGLRGVLALVQKDHAPGIGDSTSAVAQTFANVVRDMSSTFRASVVDVCKGATSDSFAAMLLAQL